VRYAVYEYVGHWSKVYSEDLSDEERARIKKALQDAYDQSGTKVDRIWGEAIEDRGSQITLSVLGQEAPLEEKERWDPDFAKRKKIIAILQPMLPEFAIHMGGTTSIDITKPGIDKAYGIAKLRDQLAMPISEMLFAGDAIFPGGNDYPAQVAGVDSIQVRDPRETARVIQTVIACLGDGTTQITSPGDLRERIQYAPTRSGDRSRAGQRLRSRRHLKSAATRGPDGHLYLFRDSSRRATSLGSASPSAVRLER